MHHALLSERMDDVHSFREEFRVSKLRTGNAAAVWSEIRRHT